MFAPLSASFLTKPLSTFPGLVEVSPFSAQVTKSPIPAQVKFAASQALAVALTGMVVTVREKEHYHQNTLAQYNNLD